MADNPYVNKVVYGDQTLIDLSSDTVTSGDVLNGVTFHDRSGAALSGSVITHNVYDGLDSTSTSDALSANQGKVLNSALADKANTSNTFTSQRYNSSDRDCNNYQKSGSYYGTWNANYPTGAGSQSGYLIVFMIDSSTASYCKQIFCPYNSNITSIRTNNNGTWTAWQELALKSDITGEDISSQVTASTGCVISYAKKIGNTIIISGRTSKITSANTSQSVGTVGTNYRPSFAAPGTVQCATTSDFGYGQLDVTSSGSIEVIYSKTTTYGLYFTVIYMI